MNDGPVLDAMLFDMDGVIIDTARVHAQARKRMFDEYLQQRSARNMAYITNRNRRG